jgi:HKD family nuclease
MLKLADQPFSEAARLGDWLNAALANEAWIRFDSAIAFVRRSGVKAIEENLKKFCAHKVAHVSIGVDLKGTSKEGLAALKETIHPHPLTVVHSAGVSTFHPKIYAFRNAAAAEVIIGSGNLTASGLYTNFEGCVGIQLDLSKSDHSAFLTELDTLLGRWADPGHGAAKILDDNLMAELEAGG